MLANRHGGRVPVRYRGLFWPQRICQALTVSDEDIAALLGADASVGDGAKLLTTITLDSQDVTLGRMTKTGDAYEPATFAAIDPGAGYAVTVDGVNHAVAVTRVLNDDGTPTFTLKADSDQIAAVYLEGIAVVPTTGTLQGHRHRQCVVRCDPRDY